MPTLRLAICQLESHPALYTSHIAYLEEPFVPGINDCSLSVLSTKGVQVEPLQVLCLREYNAWAIKRIQLTLDALKSIDPLPDVIVFPEGAVPIAALETIKEFSGNQNCTILAGTHSPQSTAAAKREYRKAGITANRINRLANRGVKNVLPFFSNGKPRFVEKQLFSPFERSAMSMAHSSDPSTLKAFNLNAGDRIIRFLPMICAEALQQARLPHEYEVVIILSYDANPSQFMPFIEHQVNNRKIVAYCNDGRIGGSMVFAADDMRRPSWMRDALPTGLPAGDNLLVVDLDLDTTAVEVGTADPHFSLQLIALRSLVPEHSEHYATVELLNEIRQHESADVRAVELADLLKSESLTPLQRLRFDLLYEQDRRGLAASDIWDALGHDYVLADIPPLAQLESQLAASCAEHLLENALRSAARNPETSQALVSFVSQCQERAVHAAPIVISSDSQRRSSIIDRERETQEICAFFEAEGARVLEVAGLPQIGKSEVLEKALQQSGLSATKVIELSSTSSAHFVLLEVLRLAGITLQPPYLSTAELV